MIDYRAPWLEQTDEESGLGSFSRERFRAGLKAYAEKHGIRPPKRADAVSPEQQAQIADEVLKAKSEPT